MSPLALPLTAIGQPPRPGRGGAGPSPSPLGSPRLPSPISRCGNLARRDAPRGCRGASGYTSAFLTLRPQSSSVCGTALGNMLATVRRSGAAWTRALLLQLLLAGPGGCLSRQELFPFGPEHGDLELEAGDDLVSPALELSTALHFFDRSDIDSVYVSATPGGRWGRVGERPRGAEAASGGRPGRAGAARGAGRTGASWAGTRTRWSPGPGCGAPSPSPRGLPPPPGQPTPPRRLVTIARGGSLGSGELAPSAPPRERTARLQDSVTRDPGTPGPRDPGGVSSPAAVGREVCPRRAIVPCFWGTGPGPLGTRRRTKARAG